MNKEKSTLSKIAQGFTGVLLLVVSFYMLFQDEAVSLGNYAALQYAKSNIVEVDENNIDEDNDGELIYVKGRIEAAIINDKEFGIKEEGVKLKRVVETYQWQEDKKVKSVKGKDKSKVKQFSYKYGKVWSSAKIDSSKFYLNKTYANPVDTKYKNKLFLSKLVFLGNFAIESDLLISNIDFEVLNLRDYYSRIKSASRVLGKEGFDDIYKHPEEFKIVGDYFYNGEDIANPKIGDIRVKFEIVKPFDATVIGLQEDKAIKEYEYGNQKLFIIKKGMMDSKYVFATMKKHTYKKGTKVLILSFVLMFIGFFLIKMPLRKIILMIPYFGVYIAFSDTKRFFVIATLLTLITGGIVWSNYLLLEGLSIAIISLIALVILRNIDYKE